MLAIELPRFPGVQVTYKATHHSSEPQSAVIGDACQEPDNLRKLYPNIYINPMIRHKQHKNTDHLVTKIDCTDNMVIYLLINTINVIVYINIIIFMCHVDKRG